jgi:hypothetical protein
MENAAWTIIFALSALVIAAQGIFMVRLAKHGTNTTTMVLGTLTPAIFLIQWLVSILGGMASDNPLNAALTFALGNSFFLYIYAKKQNPGPIHIPKLFWGILGIELILMLGGLFYFLPNPKFMEYFITYFIVLNVITIPLLLWLILREPPTRQI